MIKHELPTRLNVIARLKRSSVGALALCAISLSCVAQNFDASAGKASASAEASTTGGQQLPVNWLYGAYIPTEAPLAPLTNKDRWRLYVRQGFTTPGIWVKTGLFTVRDQATDSPPGWPQDPEGFAKRVGTRYAQFLMQNSFTAVGDAMPGWEPRYDICRHCANVGQRLKHVFVRNFAAYGSDEKSLRPQVFSLRRFVRRSGPGGHVAAVSSQSRREGLPGSNNSSLGGSAVQPARRVRARFQTRDSS